MYTSAGGIDLMSPERFLLPTKRKGLLQHTVDNEVSALAGLTFCPENLFTGRETSVRRPH